MFLFLASSFNVELVYVILKGITQFSYVAQSDSTDEKTRRKIDKFEMKHSDDGVTLHL